MVLIRTLPADAVSQRRILLLHLKCLLWCLHQMQPRYNLNVVLYSIEHGDLHPEVRDSNLGDNLAYLLAHLDPEDLGRLGESVADLGRSVGSMDIGDKHFEMGHYIQALNDFGPITAGSYGVITAITPQLRGLFHFDGDHLYEAPFAPSDVRVIFGTYIV
jgi:hypothetical protein